MKKENILILLVFIFLLLFWKFDLHERIVLCERQKLEGHWHLIPQDGERKFEKTIDFENDTIAILNKHIGGYGGTGGFHFVGSSIRFGGEGIMIEMKYKEEKGNIIFERESGNGSGKRSYFNGIRCDSNCCEKQKEYFYYENVEIDLPVIFGCNGMSFEQRNLENKLFIGKPKKEFEAEFGTKHKFSFGSKFGNMSELKLWEEKHKITVPKSQRKEIYNVIYADQSTPMKTIKPLLNYFTTEGNHNVFFAMRKETYDKELQLCLKEIDLMDYDSTNLAEISLTEWLLVKEE